MANVKKKTNAGLWWSRGIIGVENLSISESLTPHLIPAHGPLGTAYL